MRRHGTSLTGNGFRDWILQRVSAVILAVYFFYLFAYIVTHPGMDYVTWHIFFSGYGIRIFSIMSVLSVLIHAWIGMWTVSTDYLHCRWVRGLFQLFIFVALLTLFIWGIFIIWG